MSSVVVPLDHGEMVALKSLVPNTTKVSSLAGPADDQKGVGHGSADESFTMWPDNTVSLSQIEITAHGDNTTTAATTMAGPNPNTRPRVEEGAAAPTAVDQETYRGLRTRSSAYNSSNPSSAARPTTASHVSDSMQLEAMDHIDTSHVSGAIEEKPQIMDTRRTSGNNSCARSTAGVRSKKGRTSAGRDHEKVAESERTRRCEQRATHPAAASTNSINLSTQPLSHIPDSLRTVSYPPADDGFDRHEAETNTGGGGRSLRNRSSRTTTATKRSNRHSKKNTAATAREKRTRKSRADHTQESLLFPRALRPKKNVYTAQRSDQAVDWDEDIRPSGDEGPPAAISRATNVRRHDDDDATSISSPTSDTTAQKVNFSVKKMTQSKQPRSETGRKRGRPRKKPVHSLQSSSPNAGRKRGRPRKTPVNSACKPLQRKSANAAANRSGQSSDTGAGQKGDTGCENNTHGRIENPNRGQLQLSDAKEVSMSAAQEDKSMHGEAASRDVYHGYDLLIEHASASQFTQMEAFQLIEEPLISALDDNKSTVSPASSVLYSRLTNVDPEPPIQYIETESGFSEKHAEVQEHRHEKLLGARTSIANKLAAALYGVDIPPRVGSIRTLEETKPTVDRRFLAKSDASTDRRRNPSEQPETSAYENERPARPSTTFHGVIDAEDQADDADPKLPVDDRDFPDLEPLEAPIGLEDDNQSHDVHIGTQLPVSEKAVIHGPVHRRTTTRSARNSSPMAFEEEIKSHLQDPVGTQPSLSAMNVTHGSSRRKRTQSDDALRRTSPKKPRTVSFTVEDSQSTTTSTRSNQYNLRSTAEAALVTHDTTAVNEKSSWEAEKHRFFDSIQDQPEVPSSQHEMDTTAVLRASSTGPRRMSPRLNPPRMTIAEADENTARRAAPPGPRRMSPRLNPRTPTVNVSGSSGRRFAPAVSLRRSSRLNPKKTVVEANGSPRRLNDQDNGASLVASAHEAARTACDEVFGDGYHSDFSENLQDNRQTTTEDLIEPFIEPFTSYETRHQVPIKSRHAARPPHRAQKSQGVARMDYAKHKSSSKMTSKSPKQASMADGNSDLLSPGFADSTTLIESNDGDNRSEKGMRADQKSVHDMLDKTGKASVHIDMHTRGGSY